jgi:hypothetical protein
MSDCKHASDNKANSSIIIEPLVAVKSVKLTGATKLGVIVIVSVDIEHEITDNKKLVYTALAGPAL